MSSPDVQATTSSSHQIDGHSIFGLIVFILTIVFVVQGVRVSLPFLVSRSITKALCFFRIIDPPDRHAVSPVSSQSGTSTTVKDGSDLDKQGNNSKEKPNSDKGERWYLPVDLVTAPVTAVILLLATKSIDGSVVARGIVGADGVIPYDVLIMFMCLAYISTSLDSTGALRFLAFYVSQRGSSKERGGSSGAKLYLYLYVFFFICGVVVGNDPIILSGTAFLAYFTRVTGISPPTAWVFAEFIAANVASAVLVSSNPTNVLISGAFDLNFLTGYTKYTILPSLIPAIVAYPLLFLTFRYFRPPGGSTSYIPKTIHPPDVRPSSALIDPHGAIFHSVLMVVTLCTLVGSSFVQGGKVKVWMVTLPAALVAAGRDGIYDWWLRAGSAGSRVKGGLGESDKASDHEAGEGDAKGKSEYDGDDIPLDVIREGQIARPAPLRHRSAFTTLEAGEVHEGDGEREGPSPRPASTIESAQDMDEGSDARQIQQVEVEAGGDVGIVTDKIGPDEEKENPYPTPTPTPPAIASSVPKTLDYDLPPPSTLSTSLPPSVSETAGDTSTVQGSPGLRPVADPSSTVPRRGRITLPSVYRRISNRFPTLTSTLSRLPWTLLPFALAMFILVRSLGYLGWISIFATWMERVCINPAATVFFVGFMAALVLCPLCGTNIGATILLVEILKDPNFLSSPRVQADPRILRGAIFAVALGSNLGAFSFVFSSSLAGLLWASILRQKGIIIHARDFARWNLVPVILLTFISLCVVLLEVLTF